MADKVEKMEKTEKTEKTEKPVGKTEEGNYIKVLRSYCQATGNNPETV